MQNYDISLICTRHAAFMGSIATEVEIFIWIMSPVWSKKTSVAARDERNIIILHRKIVNIETIYGVYCSVWRRYICYLSILFWGCLDGVKVKDVRRCSARRARRIRGFMRYHILKDVRRCSARRARA